MPDGTLEQNKAVVRRMMEAFNTGNTAAVEELLDESVRDQSRKLGFESALRDAHPKKRLKTEILRQEDVFPDRKFREVAMVAEGDTVVLHWSMTGTHKGSLMGKAPTGKKVEVQGTEILRLRNGKIVEHLENSAHVFDVLFQLDLLDDDVVKKLKKGDAALGQGHRTAK